MNVEEKINRLERLLARVQERAAGSRDGATARASDLLVPTTPAAFVRAAPMPSEQPQPQPQTPPTPLSRPLSAPPLSSPADRPPSGRSVSYRPPPIEADVDVEISSEVVDIDIDVDEMGMPLESGAHVVADHVPLPEESAEESEEPAALDEPTLMQMRRPPANEIEEATPSSSPRPIASEQPDTYEEESAPRHTPPPESGKQATAPSVQPAAPRISSAPPTSQDEHPMMGGWREPGLPRDPMGVEPITATRASAPPRRPFEADVTRAQLGGGEVAELRGAVPDFRPATFGDLLDATLGL